MRRDELDVLVGWAAAEGWNPGRNDADIFWATDPDGFIAAELDDDLVGGGSIVSYGGTYGFMGFFIVRPDHRGHGLGNRLWHERLRLLRQRLEKPAVIGMDGVFDMQGYYAKGGFVFDGRDPRYEGLGKTGAPDDDIVDVGDVPFADLCDYDRAHFPAPRPGFLRRWVEQPGAFAKAALADNALAGFAVLRPCRVGYKLGPLFADDSTVAVKLFRSLSAEVPGELIYLDVPENNAAAVRLARNEGMCEVFGCAKMYLGPVPELPQDQIFGVTTFELG